MCKLMATLKILVPMTLYKLNTLVRLRPCYTLEDSDNRLREGLNKVYFLIAIKKWWGEFAPTP